MQKEDGLVYTGDELDVVLLEHYVLLDWVQLRKGYKHSGLSRRKIYRINKIQSKDHGIVSIIDNNGKERRVPVNRLK